MMSPPFVHGVAIKSLTDKEFGSKSRQKPRQSLCFAFVSSEFAANPRRYNRAFLISEAVWH